MGGVGSKSPLERRNTVARRSQRKSINNINSKIANIKKEIKKFKGTEEDENYEEIKKQIELMLRDLEIKCKNLQPQLRVTYRDTREKTEECFGVLEAKLKENLEKAAKKQSEEAEEAQAAKAEEEEKLEKSEYKRQTVELNLIQIQSTEPTPIDKRMSILKMGVPVMPQSIMEAMNRKSRDFDSHDSLENKISKIRAGIENVEVVISQFVGKKYGKHYNQIMEQLRIFSDELGDIRTTDEEIAEQIKLCSNYIKSCGTFLDDKAVEVEQEIEDEVFTPPASADRKSFYEEAGPLSPRTVRTTYI